VRSGATALSSRARPTMNGRQAASRIWHTVRDGIRGAALAATGTVWSVSARRSNERELLFVGTSSGTPSPATTGPDRAGSSVSEVPRGVGRRPPYGVVRRHCAGLSRPDHAAGDWIWSPSGRLDRRVASRAMVAHSASQFRRGGHRLRRRRLLLRLAVCVLAGLRAGASRAPERNATAFATRPRGAPHQLTIYVLQFVREWQSWMLRMSIRHIPKHAVPAPGYGW